MNAPPLVSQDALAETALHEAGHAVVARLLGFEILTASVARSAGEHGRVKWEVPARTPDLRELSLCVSAAGVLAERRARPSRADHQPISLHILSACGFPAGDLGAGDRELSEPDVASLADEHGVTREAIRREADCVVRGLFEKPGVWEAVEAVAREIGLSTKQRLFDYRAALERKKLVHACNDRWYITTQ